MWSLRKKRENEPSRESEIAICEAQENLERIKQRSHEVHAVTTAQKKLLERNRFVERLEVIMGGNR